MALVDQHGRPLVPTTAQRSFTVEQIFGRPIGQGGAGPTPGAVISWYYSCLTQTARGFAQMPLKLWRQTRGARGRRPGFREEFGHRAQRRIDRPTPLRSGVTWREQWASILLDGGDVFCIPDEQPDVDGLPRSLPLYGRSQVRPLRDGYDGPLISWEFRPTPRDEWRPITIDRVMHWALPNPYDDVMGLAPKDSLRMALDADFARSVYDRSFYQRAATPSGVLINKNQELDAPQRDEVRQSFEEFHGGPEKAGRLLILGNDWDFKQWALQQSQAQYIESRKFSREEIAAAFFGFPVGFLNAQEKGGISKAGADADRLVLYENCIFPLARLFEEEFNYRFIRRLDPRIQAAFDTRRAPVALAYAKIEAEIFERYVKYGIAGDDVAEALDLPFDPQPGGHIPLVSKALVPLESFSDGDQPIEVDATDADDQEVPAAAALPPAAPRRVAQDPHDPLGPVARHLRRRLEGVLWWMRRTVLRDPERAAAGASEADRREWARMLLPPLALALEGGADPGALARAGAAEIQRTLQALQARVQAIGFVNEAQNAACEAALGDLLDFLDGTLREAAAAENPAAWFARLGPAAARLTEQVLHDAVAAGAAAREAA